MTEVISKDKDIPNMQVNSSNDVVINNKDEKSNLMLKYNKYKSIFDITILKDTVILTPKYRR